MSIPKVIHRIWIGSDLPRASARSWEKWRELFPDYEQRTWREDELAKLGMPAEFHSARTYAERSDIARLRVLNACGGIYTDVDVMPLRRFDHLWTARDRLVVFEMVPGRLLNGLLAATPRSLDFVIRIIEQNARIEDVDAAPVVRTGPYALTAAVDYLLTKDGRGVRVLPPAHVSFEGSDQRTYMDLAEPHPDAVVRTLLQARPTWASAPDPAPTKRRPLTTAHETLRMLPLRLRRRLS